MGVLRNYFTQLHTSTKRDYLTRMCDAKVECMRLAKQFAADFWDGDRRYGYGGFRYDGRWKPVAKRLITEYSLTGNCSILDIGCGKGFLLYELQQLLPDAASSVSIFPTMPLPTPRKRFVIIYSYTELKTRFILQTMSLIWLSHSIPFTIFICLT